jgi:hypothetical protein
MSGHSREVLAMSSKRLRHTLLAGLAVATVLAVAANAASAQNRVEGWTLGPPYGAGNAYDIVAPGMYVGDSSGPLISVPGGGITDGSCSLLPTSPCSNNERGAD